MDSRISAIPRRIILFARQREDQRRLAAIVNSTPEAILGMDLDGTVRSFSPGAAALYGYSAEQVVGHNCRMFSSRPDFPGLERTLQRVRQGESVSEIADRERLDGTHLSVEVMTSPLRLADGSMIGICSIARDVTVRQEAEIRREVATEKFLRAEDAQRAQIAQDLHDDTVQVLVGALLKLDTVKAGIATESRLDLLPMLEEASNTLREAIHRTRRMMFELQPNTLQEQGLSITIGLLVKALAEETGIHVVCDIPEGRFPSAVERLSYRIILESIRNIRKHARAGLVTIVIQRDSHGLQTTVEDDGMGFDVSALRIENHLHLGIDSCFERVRLAGGEFGIKSSRNGGTVVTFSIPFIPLSALERAADVITAD